MSKICAKCSKTVYPIEELKCLDKIWHKTCFRCWSCGMALNMKNYKGYDKKPYCNAHYPKTKHTAVAETPEMARLAQNTKMQSQIQYHEQFEKSKGKFTVVADDPETLRIRQNTHNISSLTYHQQFLKDMGHYHAVADDLETQRHRLNQENISLLKYHEDFEKNIKGTKIQVCDDPETQRLKAASAIISQVEYKGLRKQSQDMEAHRGQIQHDQEMGAPTRGDYDPSRVGGVRMAPHDAKPSPMSAKNIGHSVSYSSQGRVEQPPMMKVGSIHDYDPLNELHGSLNSGYAPASTMQQSAQWEETTPSPLPQNNTPTQAHVPLAQTAYTKQSEPQPPSPEPARPEPSSHPPEQHYPPPQHGMQQQQQQQQPRGMPPPQQQNSAPPPQMAPPQPIAPQQPPPQQPPPQQPVPVAPPPASSALAYQAIYDYAAQDDDEISFMENDLVIDCQPIDAGWMFGTIKRTGQRGMLPANYVEKIE